LEAHFDRADVAEVNYSRAIYDPIITTFMKDGKLFLKMESEASSVLLHYTLDDAMPDEYCESYEAPIEIPTGTVTLRVISYRNGKPMGHLITLKRAELERRKE
jgi:hexosaminidase